jgi:hypothetical protein
MGAGNVKYPSIGLLSEDEDEGHEGEEDSEEVQAEQTTMLEPFGDEDDNDERGGGVHSGADDSDDDEEGDSEDESEGEQQGKETRPSVEMDMDLCSIQSNGTEMSPACVAGSMSGSVMSGLASASSLPFVTPREGEEEYEEGIERAFDESESLETVGIESAKVVPVETVTTIPICSQQEDADEGLLTGGDFLLEEASYDCGSTLDAAVQASAAEVEGEGMRGRRRLRRRRSRTIRQPPASVISELSNDGSRSGGDSTTVMSVANPSKQVQAGEEARQTVLSDIPSQYSAADSISSPGVDTCGPRSVSQDCSDRARAEQAAKNLLLEEKVKALKSQLNALERQAAAATAPTPTPSLRKRQSGMRVPMTKAKTKSKIRQRDAPPVKSMLELGGDSAPAPVPAPAPTRSGGGASALARVNSRFGPAGVEVKSSRRRGAYGVLKRMRPVATNSPARSRTEIAEADENIQVAKPRKSAAQSAAGPIGLKQRNRNRIRAEKISPQITSLQSQPSADPLIVQEWGDDDVRERQWSASLDSRWAEVEFMMRRRIEAEEDLTYNIRAAELGLAYMQKLEDKALQVRQAGLTTFCTLRLIPAILISPPLCALSHSWGSARAS